MGELLNFRPPLHKRQLHSSCLIRQPDRVIIHKRILHLWQGEALLHRLCFAILVHTSHSYLQGIDVDVDSFITQVKELGGSRQATTYMLRAMHRMLDLDAAMCAHEDGLLWSVYLYHRYQMLLKCE